MSPSVVGLSMPDTEMALLGTQFTTEEAAEVTYSLKPGDYHEEVVENVDLAVLRRRRRSRSLSSVCVMPSERRLSMSIEIE